MVRLRLSVKVCPREQEQAQADQQSPSSHSHSHSHSRPRRENKNESHAAPEKMATAKPVNFLLVLDEPDKITMGGLAGKIQEKWRKLRPNVE